MNSSGHASIVDTPTGFTIQNYANSATLGSNAWMEMGDIDVQVTAGSPFPALSGLGQPMKSFTAGVAAPETKWSTKIFGEDQDGNWKDRTIERRIVEGGHVPQHVIESSGKKTIVAGNDFQFRVQLTLVVPEPSTQLLMGLGYASLLLHRPARQLNWKRFHSRS